MKTVLITGATSGIGRACARKFSEGGYRVVAMGRNKEKLTELGLELPGEIMPMCVDIRNREQAQLAVTRIHTDWKPIDVLINNAGLAQGLGPEYDGLRIDVAHTAVRVTNLKPGLVETNFSNVRFHGDTQRAAAVYKGIKPLTANDIADVAFYAASAPEHVQIAEVLILATHQANGSYIVRE